MSLCLWLAWCSRGQVVQMQWQSLAAPASSICQMPSCLTFQQPTPTWGWCANPMSNSHACPAGTFPPQMASTRTCCYCCMGWGTHQQPTQVTAEVEARGQPRQWQQLGYMLACGCVVTAALSYTANGMCSHLQMTKALRLRLSGSSHPHHPSLQPPFPLDAAHVLVVTPCACCSVGQANGPPTNCMFGTVRPTGGS